VRFSLSINGFAQLVHRLSKIHLARALFINFLHFSGFLFLLAVTLALQSSLFFALYFLTALSCAWDDMFFFGLARLYFILIFSFSAETSHFCLWPGAFPFRVS
jgi:hypothetical protein